jgi:hypothetical protein
LCAQGFGLVTVAFLPTGGQTSPFFLELLTALLCYRWRVSMNSREKIVTRMDGFGMHKHKVF